jgi:hypothetical protein
MPDEAEDRTPATPAGPETPATSGGLVRITGQETEEELHQPAEEIYKALTGQR